jgi:hypothetical protein
MSAVLDKINALAAKAVADGVDMTQAKAGGGGDYTPPAEGPTRLRFVSYIEIGKQKDEFQGKPRNRDKAIFVFELSGPKHPPTVLDDGTKVPMRISIEETVSLNEKANFYKLFTRMNYSGKAKHIAQLLGEAFKARVVHRKYAKKGEPKADPSKWTGIAVELRTKSEGYTIEAPRYEVVDENGPTGEFKVLPVDPPLTTIKCFLWNYADKADWDSIFIDGTYEEKKNDKGEVISPARSKNVYQNKIKLAVNFQGSPIHAVLAAAGGSIDIPDAEDARGGDEAPAEDEDAAPSKQAEVATPTGAAADDVLNGVV